MSKPGSDAPRLDRDNSLEIDVVAHPFSFKRDPKNPLNEKVVEAINQMGATGEDAEKKYQAALAALREHQREVVSIAAAEYEDLPRQQYLDRWSLVQLLAELKEASSLDVLGKIIVSRIPAEESEDPHSFSTVGEEVMIRTTAVEAITRMAADGNREALDLLLEHATHDNFSVKRASVQGYLSHGGPDAREKLLRVLPKEDHAILDIRQTDVREVPQAEGGLFVVNSDSDDLPPLLPERSEDDDTP